MQVNTTGNYIVLNEITALIALLYHKLAKQYFVAEIN
jgi:hypothetical protein